MVETFVEQIEKLKLYRQERVIRWQTREYMFPSNDAAHQLYVTQVILLLADHFQIPDKSALAALKYGCCHDYVESTENSVGDVNYMVKEQNPELKKLIKKQERVAMQQVAPFYKAMVECEQDNIAMTIVELADSMEAFLYVRRELLFNKQTKEWEQIHVELLKRLTMLWNHLENLVKEESP